LVFPCLRPNGSAWAIQKPAKKTTTSEQELKQKMWSAAKNNIRASNEAFMWKKKIMGEKKRAKRGVNFPNLSEKSPEERPHFGGL